MQELSTLLLEMSAAPSRRGPAEACAVALRRAIVSGQLPAGVRLPPERALAASFGVNRVSVREALAQLEAEHLVTVRQGSGYTVRDYRRTAGPDLVSALVMEGGVDLDVVRDLLLVRRELAAVVLRRAARAPAEARAPLEAAVARLDALAASRPKAPVADIARADLDVVAELVALAGSTVMQLFMNPIARVLFEVPGLAEAMYRAPKENVLAWQVLLAWLVRGGDHALGEILRALEARDEQTLRLVARRGKK